MVTNIRRWSPLFVLCFSFCVLAQTAAPVDPEHEDDTGVIEELKVTARQREEKLEKVPITATVFSAAEIKSAGIKTVADFINLTSNVSFGQSQNPGNVLMTVRGISQVRNGDAPFAVVIDGVYQASPNAINQNLFDVERIEVLKGPQGALYGRNAIGGVISIITEKPTNEAKYYATASLGNASEKFAALSASGPITENLFYRVSGQYRDREGYFTNVTLNQDADPKTDKDAALWLNYYPTEDWSLDLKISGSNVQDGGAYFIPVFSSNANEVETSPESNLLPSAERDLREYSLKAQYSQDWGSVSILASKAKVDELAYADDYLALSILWASQHLVNDSDSYELKYTSPSSNKFRWIVGAFSLKSEKQLDTVVDIDFNNDLVYDYNITRREDNDNRTHSYFAQGNYDLTEKVELSLALRSDSDKRDQFNPTDNTTRSKTFSKVQPRFSISWSPDANSMVFGSYAEGFRSGGYNAPGVTAFPDVFRKETTETMEVGYKSVWGDRRFQFNASVFHTDFKDQQYFEFDGPTSAQGILNIPKSTAEGLEVEAQAALAMGFRIGGAVGVTDTELEDLGIGDLAYLGNKSPNVDAYTGNLMLLHETKLSEDHSVVARVDYRRTGKRYWQIDNDDYREPYGLLNLRLTYQTAKWKATAFADNLTNTKYNTEFLASQFTGLTYDLRFPARPRIYGVEFQTRF